MKKILFVIALLYTSIVCAEEKIIVFAAASLTNALSEVSAQFEQQTGIKVLHSFAASSTLAKQIDNSAPADIFISADNKWMDYLESKSKIDKPSRKPLLTNQLVIISPKAKRFHVEFKDTFDFAKAFDGKLCTGDIESVPAGIYAKESLLSLGWWQSIRSRIVGTQDVRGALNFVERGECVGIVYLTDAKLSNKSDLVGIFPENTHSQITYPVALIKKNNASELYMSFLQSTMAKTVFAKYGFQF